MLVSRREGFALALTIMLITAVAVLAAGAMVMGMNSSLVSSYASRQEELAHAADGALEHARALLNADRTLYPDSQFATLEDDVPVLDGSGTAIPGLSRSSYAGPVGITSGQFGVHGAVVSVVRSGPNVVVRRSQVTQESFSKFAYFTDVEPSTIAFGGGDQIFGPVHSNDDIRIYSSGATFFGPVKTARSIIDGRYASFREGFTESAANIPMPRMADLQKLSLQATQGGTRFTSNSGNPHGRARMRIEFVAIDVNGDGDATDDNEGFARVFQSNSADWVVGANPTDNLRDSRNCGHFHSGVFVSADDHGTGGGDNYMAALSNSTRRCFLGGAPELTNGWLTTSGSGTWRNWGGTISPLLTFRADRAQLFPINRPMNPDFKGVIYVDGDVAISGVLRGRVTVAATGNIVIADDVTYATDPSVGRCEDILGMFAGGNVVVANTPIMSGWRRAGGGGQNYFSYDDTTSEFVHGFILTLNVFTVEDFDSGPTGGESCQTTNWGRGCLYLTGGVIQRERGPVGQSNGTGYLKRYSYDPCGETDPPPYFPTTGHFTRGAHYEVDPAGFDIGTYFGMLTAGG